jgi:hypothetical protein
MGKASAAQLEMIMRARNGVPALLRERNPVIRTGFPSSVPALSQPARVTTSVNRKASSPPGV